VRKCDNADVGTVLMVLLQRRGQSCRAAGVSVCTSNTNSYSPLCPTTTLPVTHTAYSSATTLVTGRSPSLVAMERVMPKYATSASSDAVDTRGRLLRDRKNIVNGSRPTDAVMQPDGSAVVSPCRNASVQPVHQLPASTAAGGGSLGLMSGDVLSSSSSVNGSVRSAKEELRARLTHRPASNSALYSISQVVGKTAFMIT